MNDAEHITVTPLSSISPEQARDTRARAWAFVFQCWQEKQMTTEPTPEPDCRDGTKLQGDSADAQIISR
jgi:hypothetical protein